jgi:hypothetical protein
MNPMTRYGATLPMMICHGLSGDTNSASMVPFLCASATVARGQRERTESAPVKAAEKRDHAVASG